LGGVASVSCAYVDPVDERSERCAVTDGNGVVSVVAAGAGGALLCCVVFLFGGCGEGDEREGGDEPKISSSPLSSPGEYSGTYDR